MGGHGAAAPIRSALGRSAGRAMPGLARPCRAATPATNPMCSSTCPRSTLARSAVNTVGNTAQQALGPGGAATEAAQGVGDAAQQAVSPGGAVSETADAAGQAAQG